MGKPVASQFWLMVSRIQDWLILIPFDNSVYHLPKSISFNEKRPRKSETDIQKRFAEIRNFRLEVSNQENSRMPFQTFRLFQEFSTETSKATWVNGKPGKVPKC